MQGDLGSIILGDVADETPFPELEIALETLLTVGHDLEGYDDDYVRRYAGSVRAWDGDEVVGSIELWYFDGSRAMERGFDIVDVCDSLGQAEYDYASAVYTGGTIDASISEAPVYNDVLVVHELAVEARYRELGIEAQVIRKIAATVGYHTATVVAGKDIADTAGIDSVPTKSSSLRAMIYRSSRR